MNITDSQRKGGVRRQVRVSDFDARLSPEPPLSPNRARQMISTWHRRKLHARVQRCRVSKSPRMSSPASLLRRAIAIRVTQDRRLWLLPWSAWWPGGTR